MTADKKINEINARPGLTFVVAHNHMSTWTQDEYQALLGKKSLRDTSKDKVVSRDTSNLDDTLDWRTKGAVNKIQDQGGCGACWAFSPVSAMESDHFIKNGTLLKLSEQQIIDCDHNKDQGCKGGEEQGALDYAKLSPLELESDYKYTGNEDEKCKYDASKGVLTIKDYDSVPSNDASQLKAAIAVGPVSVGVDGTTDVFQYYHGGIFGGSYKKELCGTDINHAMVAVGYGVEEGKTFWIVRNSWSQYWGEQGYIRMEYTDDEKDEGICGILKDSCRPNTVLPSGDFTE